MWVCAGSLWVWDDFGRTQREAKERFSGANYDRYKLLEERMFPPIDSRRRMERKNFVGEAKEELQRAEEPVHGMLYRVGPDGQGGGARADILDEKANEFSALLEDQGKIGAKLISILKLENQAIALFVPSSYQREIFTKRAITLLVEVLGLLFVASLYVPFGEDIYLCPQIQTTNAAGGGLLQPPTGTFLDLVVWYVKDSISGTISNFMWLLPGGWFLWSLYDAQENINKTRDFHETRLFELSYPHYLLEVAAPRHAADPDELRVALNMLHAAKLFLESLLRAIEFRQRAVEVEQKRQEHYRIMDEAALRAAGPGHHEIEEHYELIKYYLGRIEKGGIKSIDERLSELVVEGEQKKMEDSAQAERSSDYWWSRCKNCWRRLGYPLKVFSRRRQRTDAIERVALASLPATVQINAARRAAMKNSIDGRSLVVLGRALRVPCCFWPLAKRLKVHCFEQYSSIEDSTDGALEPLKKMLRRQKFSLKIGAVYLMLITLFIFLAAVRINDNKAIWSIMITTLTSEISGIVFVQPMEVFILGALIPAIGAYLIRRDVALHMESERARGRDIGQLDHRRQRGMRLPADLDYSEMPFEVSPEWRNIEQHEVFRDGEFDATHGQQSVMAGSLFLTGGPASWDLCVRLHQLDVRTLSELSDLPWGTLAEKCGLTPVQVHAAWRAVHPDQAPPVRLEGLVAKSNWKRLKKKTSAVMPILMPCDSGTNNNDDNDDHDGNDGNDGADDGAELSLPPIAASNADGDEAGARETKQHADDDEAAEEGHPDLKTGVARDADPVQSEVCGWLNSLEASYGASYGHIFERHGAHTIGDLRALTETQLQRPLDELGKATARRKIRTALRLLRKSSKESTVLDALQAPPSIEEWLDGIYEGYGTLYAHHFRKEGVDRADQLRDVPRKSLGAIVKELKEKGHRRALRSALKMHIYRDRDKAP